jgi:protein tyrosine/serine phosphatase
MSFVPHRNFVQKFVGIIIATFAFAAICVAQETAQKAAYVKIKNFGQMDDRFYRGAQPKETDYKDLAALGVKTVIDLTDDPKPYEKTTVESLGMRYVNIPMIEKKYPTAEATQAFLKTVSDPNTGKFFLHCAGGRHRTGAMGAVYRYEFYGWNFDQVYKEMKDYDFYTAWGHGAFKDFVKDYYERKHANPTATAETTQGAPVRQNKN